MQKTDDVQDRNEVLMRKVTASCRLSRDERALVEAAAARRGYEFVSGFMRAVLLEEVQEQLGPGVVQVERDKDAEAAGD